MKITLINTWRVFDAKGGTEKVFCDMANALAQRGHNVTAICCEERNGEPGFPLDEKVNLVNAGLVRVPFHLSKFIKLRALSFSSKKRKLRRYELSFGVLKYKLQQVLSNLNTDVIITFQPTTTYIVKSIVGETIPLVTMIHNVPKFYFPKEMPSEVKSIIESSDVIQVLRPEYERALLEVLPSARVVVIPNVVPQSKDRSDCKNRTIVNIGRISKQKRQPLLVEAFALINDKFPEWKLELWGEEHVELNYTQELKSIIKSKNLESQVALCGTTDDVLACLKQAAIFAFPSEFEGWGLALTEAMSMGLPSIGCKECPAINTLIKDGENGLLCDATPESLSQALTTLMTNEELRIRLGSQAKEDMKAFSPEIVWGQWELLLQSLVKTKV